MVEATPRASRRILVADYSGHPFQVQLSRALAARGYQVLHLYSASSETPKGEMARRSDDPPNFQICGVSLGEPFNKTNFLVRRRQEKQIGVLFAEVIAKFKPHVGIFSNQPIDTLSHSVPALEQAGGMLVFWLQDLLGEAATRVLSSRLGFVGRIVGEYYRRREARVLQNAAHVVAISEDFRPVLEDALGIPSDRVTIIENWAPIDDLPLYPRDSDWVRENLPNSRYRIIYSGTLGFKQDPEALLEIAAAVDGCDVLIFSQGEAARAVETKARDRGLTNIVIRDWLDFADLPKALGGADLLVVLLEPDAGLFSVPSKVLTYLCMGRPILGSIDAQNLAARIIDRSGAGVTHQPGDHQALIDSVRTFMADPAASRMAGQAARAYAERVFNIDTITDRFDAIVRSIPEGEYQ